jgi:short-subunit dehydrogenase
VSDFTRALVTGASSGIGTAIAREYAKRGVDLVLVARREDRLKAIADELTEEFDIRVEVLVADLTTEEGRLTAEQRLASDDRQIDVLVNNAGMVVDEELADSDPEVRIMEVELNVVAVTRLATTAASTFRARGRGGICNVSSVTAFWPVPGNATYAAGKAYVLALSEALHVEREGTGVHVSAVCPGFTRTEIFQQGGVDVSTVPGPLWLDAHDVARAAVDGVEANDAVVTPGSLWQAMRLASRVTPPPLARRMTGIVERVSRIGR